MMNKLKAKLKNQGGFTLVEMLIVVAIIAILVAVSIPLIGSILEKTRIGVDEANERSAMSMAVTYYLTNYDDLKNEASTNLYYYVDAKTHEGQVVKATTENATLAVADNFKYGLSSTERGINSTAEPKGAGVIVTIDDKGNITKVEWSKTPLTP